MYLRTPFSAATLTLVLTSPLAAQVLVSGDRTLSFPAGNAGRGIAIASASGTQTAAQSTQPVTFFVCGPCTDEKSTQVPLAIGYGAVHPRETLPLKDFRTLDDVTCTVTRSHLDD